MSNAAGDMETVTRNRNPNLRCRVCLSGSLKELPFGYLWEGRWFAAVCCERCGVIFLDPQPGPEDLARMYTREYFEKDFRCGHTGSYFDETTRKNLQNDPLLKRIVQMKPPKARFLEVGCAGGAFLDAARLNGYDVKGVEFSEQAARFARENYGLDVRTGEIASAGFSADFFDIIFLGDVLEHLLDPVASLVEIHRILRPGGLVVAVCPSQTNTLFSRAGFLVYGLLGRRTSVQLPPYHVFEYRPRSIARLFEQCGFRVQRQQNDIIAPSEIALRGPTVQRILKKIFQYPNVLVTDILGCCGDRLELYATKTENYSPVRKSIGAMITVTDHDRRYWQYEYDTTARYLVPLLREWGISTTGVSLLDVGCGDGGNLCAMVDAGLRCKGFDLEPRRIELAERMKGNRQCEFTTGDLASEIRPFENERFDLVFLHDVFEHLERKGEMLSLLGRYLVSGGQLIITFPPYYSAFGAHQQLLKSWLGRIPFVHLLPGMCGTIIPALPGEASVFIAEIQKLARSKMGISAFEKIVGSSGFSIKTKQLYLISPNHIRFGLSPAGAGIIGRMPGVREIIVSGVVYLLSKTQL